MGVSCNINRTNIKRGFTLVEVLVVISIVSLLISILLPAVAGSRDRARQLSSLVKVRTLANALTQRTQGIGGRFPVPEPGVAYPVPFISQGGVFAFPYWQFVGSWPGIARMDQGYVSSIDAFISPGAPDLFRSQFPWNYVLTATVGGQPALWGNRELTVSEIQAMRRGQRLSDVAFPSAKAMLWDGYMGYIGQRDREKALGEHGPIVPFPVATMDTAADMRSVPDLPAERINRDPQWIYEAFRLHHTPDGILGVDFGGG